MSGDLSGPLGGLMRSDSFGLLPLPFVRILGQLGGSSVERSEPAESPVCERSL